MKVLGTNGSQSCIVEMTKDEFAQLAGFHSAYHTDDRHRMAPGVEMEIAPLFTDATGLVSLYSEFKKDLANNQARLGRLAEILNPAPVLDPSKAKK